MHLIRRLILGTLSRPTTVAVALSAAAGLTTTCILPEEPTDPTAVIEFQIENDTVIVAIGATASPQITVLADGEPFAEARIHLESIDPTIIAINQDSLLQAVARGSTQVRVELVSGASGEERPNATFAVRVIIKDMTAPPADTMTSLGDTILFSPGYLDADGQHLAAADSAKIEPQFELISSGDAVSVDAASGAIVAVGNGTDTVRASVDTSSVEVEVAVRQLAAQVSVSPSPLEFRSLNETRQCVDSAWDARGNLITDRAAPTTWSLSDSSVVSITSQGLVTALVEGQVTVTATVDATSGTTSVSVNQLPSGLREVSGNGQVGTAGQALGAPFVVQLVDSGGTDAPKAGVNVEFKVTSGGGKLAGQDLLLRPTDALGRASATLTLSTVADQPDTVIVTGTGLDSSVTFTATGGVSLDSSVVTVSAGTITSGATATLTLQAKDALGDPLTSGTLNVAFGHSGGSSTGTIGPTTDNGDGTYTATFVGVQTGTATTISATIGGAVVTSTLPSIAVTPSAAAQLAFSISPSNATAGVDIAPSVEVRIQDAAGNLVPTATNAITLAINANPGIGTLFGTVTKFAVSGVAQFSDLKIDKIGNGYTLAASSATLTAATSNQFNIGPGSGCCLVFTAQPTATAAASVISPAVQVSVQDQLGNTVTTATNQITLQIVNNPSGGVLAGTATVSAVSGVATFSDLSIDKAGTGYTLEATATLIQSGASDPFDITAAGATQLSFAVQPSNVSAGAAITPAVQLAVQDAQGNTVAGATDLITIAIETNAGGGTLSGTATVAAVDGIATFSNLSIDKVGTGYTLSATSGVLTGASSQAFNVTAGAPAQLAFTVQPSNTTAGSVISPAVQVTVQDANGNAVGTATNAVTLSIGTNPAGGILFGTVTRSAVGGVATFSDLSIDKAGIGYTLTASATGLTGASSAAFNITSSATVSASLSSASANPTTGVVADGVQTSTVTVTVRDPNGNLVSGQAVQLSASGTGNTITQPAVATDANGVATGTIASTVAETKTVTVTVNPGAGQVVLNDQPTVGFIADPGTVSATLSTVGLNPASVVADGFQKSTVTVTVVDANSNAVSGQTVQLSASGTGNTITQPAATTDANGVATGTIASSVAEIKTVTATVNPGVGQVVLTSQPTVTFTADPGTISATLSSVTAAPNNVTADGIATSIIDVTVRDAGGNPVAAQSVVISATGSGNTITQPPTTAPAGLATGAIASTVAETKTITVTVSPGAGQIVLADQPAIAFVAGPASKVAFTFQPANATAGDAIAPAVQVTIQDAVGNTVTTATNSVTLAFGTDPSGGTATLSGTTTVAAVGGVATFSNLSIDKAVGGYTLAATSGILTGATSNAFDVSHGAAAALVFNVQPSNVVAGDVITPAGQVTIQDAFGNTVASASDAVTVAIGTNPAGGTLFGTTTRSAVSGVATFNDLSIDKAAAGYTLTATSGTLTAATSVGFEVVAGVPSRVGFVVQPSNTAAGAAISPAVQVAVQDQFGNTVTTAADSVFLDIASNPAGGTLSGTTRLAAAGGIATFSDLSINNVGTGYTLRATTGPPGPLAADTSAAFNITAADAAKLAFTVQPSSASAGDAITPAVQVTVQDALGNTVTTATNSITVAIGTDPSGATATLSGTKTVAAVNGVATFSDLSIDKAASGYTLTASAALLTGATSTIFNITPAAPAELVFTIEPSNTISGVSITPPVEVTIKDAFGNTVTSATNGITVAIANNAAGGTLFGATAKSAVNGFASFTDLSIDKAGTGYTLTATTGPPGPLAPDTSVAFDITVGSAKKLGFVVQPSDIVTNQVITPSVQVAIQDSLGNTVTTATGTVTLAITGGAPGAALLGTTAVAAVSGVATFSDLSVDSAGTGYTLAATSPTLTGATSAPFNVTLRPVASVVVSPAGASITGSTQTFTAEARDSLGNLVPGKTFTWSSLNTNVATINTVTGVATPAASGQVTIKAEVDNAVGYALLTVTLPSAAPVNLWASMTSGTTATLLGVWGASSSDVFAVGQPGRIIHYDGTGWTTMTSGTMDQLNAVWGTSSSDAYVAGINGLVLRYDGSTWSPMNTGTFEHLFGVWGSSPADIFAVGSPGLVIHYDGAAWSPPMATGTTEQLNAAWGTSSSGVFVVGNNGTILHYDGSSWTAMASGITTGDNLLEVWGTSGSDVFAVGTGATILHYDGVDWSPMSAGTVGNNSLIGVSGISSTDVVAVGGSFVDIVQYDSANWNPQPPFVTGWLRGVWATSSDAGTFAVGDAGAVIGGLRGATVTVTPSIDTLTALGDTVRLSVQAQDAAGNPISGVTFTWSSSNTSVATVDAPVAATALVTAAGTGTATITATAPGGAGGSAMITVAQQASSVTVSPAGASITGGTQTFTVSAQDANGNAIASPTVTWSSLNTNVAGISAAGIATAAASGQATIKAEVDGVVGYALLTVSVPGVAVVNLWSTDATGLTGLLTDVWGASGSDVFTVGNSPTVFRYDGSSWNPTSTGAPNLFGLWGTSASDVYAVGTDGTTLHYDGNSWSSLAGGLGTFLNRVWGSSSSDVFAVGLGGTIAHYDGTDWNLQQSGTGNYLFRDWGTSSSDVFAVGDGGIIVHYDGTSWSSMTSGTTENLRGVWGTSSSDVFAVGLGGTILHYDGTAWTSMVSGATDVLYDVWGTSSSDVYAMGGTVVHYDGTSWMEIGNVGIQVIGAWGTSASDAFAVGSFGTVLRGVRGASVFVTPMDDTLTALGNTVQLSAAAQDASANAISGVTFTWSSNNTGVATVDANGLVTAVANGTATITATASGGASGGAMITVAQQAVSVTVSPAGASITGGTQAFTVSAQDANGNAIPSPTVTWSSLNTNIAGISAAGIATAVASGQVTMKAQVDSAVGYALLTVAIPGATPVNLWSSVGGVTSNNLRDVWGTSASDLYAVGDNGTILHYDGNVWTGVANPASGTTIRLEGVWGTSSGDVYAAGGSGATVGKILYYDGTAWTTVLSPAKSLFAVWGSSPSDAHAVGIGGTDLHYDGSVWGTVSTPVLNRLEAVWGSSASDVFATGDGGTILHYDGNFWTDVSFPTSAVLADVWGMSGVDAYAVGTSGTILRYNGTAWNAVGSPTLEILFAVWGSSSSDVYAAGAAGTILHYDGTAWSSVSSPTGNTLLGLWGAPQGDVFAVGLGGTILRGFRGATVSVTPSFGPNMSPGATRQLSATATDASSNAISGVTFTWASSNPAVATVSQSGLVTAVGAGTATIRARAPGGASGTSTVNVSP